MCQLSYLSLSLTAKYSGREQWACSFENCHSSHLITHTGQGNGRRPVRPRQRLGLTGSINNCSTLPSMTCCRSTQGISRATPCAFCRHQFVVCYNTTLISWQKGIRVWRTPNKRNLMVWYFAPVHLYNTIQCNFIVPLGKFLWQWSNVT